MMSLSVTVPVIHWDIAWNRSSCGRHCEDYVLMLDAQCGTLAKTASQDSGRERRGKLSNRERATGRLCLMVNHSGATSSFDIASTPWRRKMIFNVKTPCRKLRSTHLQHRELCREDEMDGRKGSSRPSPHYGLRTYSNQRRLRYQKGGGITLRTYAGFKTCSFRTGRELAPQRPRSVGRTR